MDLYVVDKTDPVECSKLAGEMSCMYICTYISKLDSVTQDDPR